MRYEPTGGLFTVATILRDPTDTNARALANYGLLRYSARGTRSITEGVPPELMRRKPAIGLVHYLGARWLPPFYAEGWRFRLHPWFDRWTNSLIQPGDHLISSFGFTNESFRAVRASGGKTFYSAGNSHPANLWAIMEEENRRWKCPQPPYARFQHRRVLEMMPLTDYVLSPSSFVTRSFVAEGFRPEQILRNIYPVNLDCFTPRKGPRPSRPLTVISTGSLSLRKGSPYLLEAFRLVLKRQPQARLLLTDDVMDSVKPVLAHYNDLPIEWAPALPHPQLAERLRGADIFVLPSLEDGFARTVTEALACGLPVVTTPNTGAADFVTPGVNGEIVPIRDAPAIAEAISKWADIILSSPEAPPIQFDVEAVSYDRFDQDFLEQLATLGLIRPKKASVASAMRA